MSADYLIYFNTLFIGSKFIFSSLCAHTYARTYARVCVLMFLEMMDAKEIIVAHFFFTFAQKLIVKWGSLLILIQTETI